MKKIVLTSSVYETNGGCNACVPYEVTIYKIRLNNIDYPLDELTVSNLVNMIVRKSGYQQETISHMFDDQTLFKNLDYTIEYTNDSGLLSYTNGTESIQSADLLQNKELIFTKANEILTQIFHLEACDFILQEEEGIHR